MPTYDELAGPGPLAKALAQNPDLFGGQMPPRSFVPERTRLGMAFTDKDQALMRLIEMANRRREQAQVMDAQQGNFPPGAGWEKLFDATSEAMNGGTPEQQIDLALRRGYQQTSDDTARAGLEWRLRRQGNILPNEEFEAL